MHSPEREREEVRKQAAKSRTQNTMGMWKSRQTEKDRETESEKSPSGGMATPQSLLLQSPLGILSTHAHAPSVSFKPPGPGRGLQSTTWESSDIAFMLTAGPIILIFHGCFLNLLDTFF